MSRTEKDKKKDHHQEGDSDDEIESMLSPEKGGMGTRMKKNIAGKFMTSSLGQKIIPSQARGLLKALRRILAKVYGEKKAKEVIRGIIKLIVKAKIIVDEKKVTEEDFLQADAPLRKAFNVIVDLYDYYGDPVNAKTKLAFETASKHLQEVGGILSNLMKPYLQPKNLQRLKDVFDVLSAVDFYVKAWENPDTNKDLDDLIDAMNKYTQFNF